MSTLWAGLRKNIQSSLHIPCTCVTFSRRALNIEHITHTHTRRYVFSSNTARCISENAKKHFLSSYNERTQVSTTTKNSPSC